MQSFSFFVSPVLVVCLSSSACGGASVVQIGTDLYIAGDSAPDYLEISNHNYDGSVLVKDAQTGIRHKYYGVDKVWVDTGNGDDTVSISSESFFDVPNADICLDTGGGSDTVEVGARQGGNSIKTNTGNGSDTVDVHSVRNGNSIEINTGNDDDYVYSFSRGRF